jgi:predicted metal-binding protein
MVMGSQINADIKYLRALGSEIQSLKSVCHCEKNTPCTTMLEGLLRGIDKMARPDSLKLGNREYERLKHLLQQCKTGPEETQHMHRIALEIGELASPGDPACIEALSHLLSHQDKRVRISACLSIGRIGGRNAEQILKELINVEDPEMKRAATEAHSFCRSSLLADHLTAPYMQKTRAIEKEKQDLKMLLSEKYGARTILLCSGGFFLGFILALVAWYHFNFTIVHPALSFLGALVSAGFVVLSVWRYRCTEQ